MKVEEVMPYAGEGADKRGQIVRAFDAVAPRYDALNRVLSLGLDLSWRRRALRALAAVRPAPGRILDAATGTGDFAILAARRFPGAEIDGLDLSAGMLAAAGRKIAAAGLSGRIALHEGDALSPPFPEGRFDAVTVAFGLRNFAGLAAGLSALRRQLAPGGVLLVLELSRPVFFPLRPLHRLYLRFWIPRVGRWLAGHEEEYRYLPASVERVPQGEEMLALLRGAGFAAPRAMRYTAGCCTCYLAEVHRK